MKAGRHVDTHTTFTLCKIGTFRQRTRHTITTVTTNKTRSISPTADAYVSLCNQRRRRRRPTPLDSRWSQLAEQRGELRRVPHVVAGDHRPYEGRVHGHPEPDAQAHKLDESRSLDILVHIGQGAKHSYFSVHALDRRSLFRNARR